MFPPRRRHGVVSPSALFPEFSLPSPNPKSPLPAAASRRRKDAACWVPAGREPRVAVSVPPPGARRWSYFGSPRTLADWARVAPGARERETGLVGRGARARLTDFSARQVSKAPNIFFFFFFFVAEAGLVFRTICHEMELTVD